MSMYSFDATAILRLGTPSTEPLPAPEPGVTILRISDGLTLQALRDSPVGKQLLHNQHWYDEYPWSQAAPPAGVYRLRVPVPGSNRKTAQEQDAMLPAGESPAPVVLVVAALLCVALEKGPDPLQNGWMRCLEETIVGYRVVLAWYYGRLFVGGRWGGRRLGRLWSSSVRTS